MAFIDEFQKKANTGEEAEKSGYEKVTWIKIPNDESANVLVWLPKKPTACELWEADYNPKDKERLRSATQTAKCRNKVRYYSSGLITDKGVMPAILQVSKYILEKGIFDDEIAKCLEANPDSKGVIVNFGRFENSFGKYSICIKKVISSDDDFGGVCPDITKMKSLKDFC